ncbi:hypothetical protein ABZ554_45980, partial [Streptomyces sp. NPDC020125]|uniref:hypothetical protein n=1 Tax=Streptomyces sp. NPDC020125 TaxID=3154593 RepID=UPI0033FA8A58
MSTDRLAGEAAPAPEEAAEPAQPDGTGTPDPGRPGAFAPATGACWTWWDGARRAGAPPCWTMTR